jgi:hypothetical protein
LARVRKIPCSLGRKRAIFRAPTGDAGMSLVEICVASMVLTVMLIGVVASMGAGLTLVGQSRQRSSATEVAQQAIEHVHGLPYNLVALDSAPIHSADPTNPDSFVTGTTYDQDGAGPQPSEPLIIDSVTPGGVTHIDDPMTVGTALFSVYSYVTWVDDPSVPGTTNYKRVVVVVTPENAAGQKTTNSVTQSTFISDGSVTLPASTPQPPGASGGATHLSIAAPTDAVTTQGISITVTAQDDSNVTVAPYRGQIHFASSDPLASLPADYTYTSLDDGVHQFTATFNTIGQQTITAVDVQTSRIAGSATISLTAPVPCPGDHTPPSSTSIQLSSTTDATTGTQQGYASQRSVTVTVRAIDSGATDGQPCAPITVDLSNDDVNWTMAVTQVISGRGTDVGWNVPSGDGTKWVYARFRDGVGNVSPEISTSFTLDTTFPTAPGTPFVSACSLTGNSRYITLGWAASTDQNFSGYKLVRTDPGGLATTVYTSTASYQDMTILTSTIYTYVVFARDKAGNATTSPVATITTTSKALSCK